MSTGAATEVVGVPKASSFDELLTTMTDELPSSLPEPLLTSADFRRKLTTGDFVRLYDLGFLAEADLLLVIEVMDSSAHLDRQVKLPLDASARIPETWLIDIPSLLIMRPGESIAPESFADIVLSVSRIFGMPASESES
jgi:hypothetical protein